jgi:uncharacterized SAM-binding protein YcdF (DUF218 family)
VRRSKLYAALLLLAAFIAALFFSFPRAGSWLDAGERPRKVDFVMSLPGDEDYRPFMAAAMIRMGLAQYGLIVQNEPSPEELDGLVVPTSTLIHKVYTYSGIGDEKLIVLDGKSVSTAGDIEAMQRLLKGPPEATAAVVTSDYHTRRARWTVDSQLGATARRVIILSAPNAAFDCRNWWQSEDGFVMVVTEYLKLVAYIFVYGNGLFWILVIVTVVLSWKIHRAIRARRKLASESDQLLQKI